MEDSLNKINTRTFKINSTSSKTFKTYRNYINIKNKNLIINLEKESSSLKLENYITRSRNNLYDIPSKINNQNSICLFNNNKKNNADSPEMLSLKLGFDLLSHKIDRLNNIISDDFIIKKKFFFVFFKI